MKLPLGIETITEQVRDIPAANFPFKAFHEWYSESDPKPSPVEIAQWGYDYKTKKDYHGSNGYTSRGCRCDVCRKAHNRNMRLYRRNKKLGINIESSAKESTPAPPPRRFRKRPANT